jgi:hypothetical protein
MISEYIFVFMKAPIHAQARKENVTIVIFRSRIGRRYGDEVTAGGVSAEKG